MQTPPENFSARTLWKIFCGLHQFHAFTLHYIKAVVYYAKKKSNYSPFKNQKKKTIGTVLRLWLTPVCGIWLSNNCFQIPEQDLFGIGIPSFNLNSCSYLKGQCHRKWVLDRHTDIFYYVTQRQLIRRFREPSAHRNCYFMGPYFQKRESEL